MCEIHQMHNILVDIIKVKLFLAILKDRAKDWFLKLEKSLLFKSKLRKY